MRKLILTISLLAGFAPSAWCVPQVLNFQGRLLEFGALSNGSRTMIFRIFDAAGGGNLLFTESRSVNVSTGVFNVLVGDVTTGGIPLSVFDGGDRYIEVQVGVQTLPRQRVVSGGYSFRSQSAAFAAEASTAAFAQRAAVADSISGGMVVSVTTITATTIHVTTITVTNIVATSGTVSGFLKVGKNTIILGESPQTGGVPNTIAFTGGNALIKTQAPSEGSLTLEAGGAQHIVLNPGGNVGIGTVSPGAKLDVAAGGIASGQANSITGGLALYNAVSPHATVLQAGNATSAVTYKLPPTDGQLGQVLTTDGAGNLQWTYVVPPVPTLTTIAPSSGSTAGGAPITLGGTGFKSGATVAVGGNLATDVVFVNTTQIAAKSPPGVAGPQNVKVTNPDSNFTTLIGAFTYVPPPGLQTIVPNTGLTTGGQSITLNGTGFQNGATVTIGGTPATGIVFVNSTQLKAVTPALSAGSYNVVVTNPDSELFTLNGAFTYNVACDGVLYQGACWYFGGGPCQNSVLFGSTPGQCNTHGGYNALATTNISGSGAPDASGCHALTQLFNIPTPFGCNDMVGFGRGCWVQNPGGGGNQCFRDTSATIGNGGPTSDILHACACNN